MRRPGLVALVVLVCGTAAHAELRYECGDKGELAGFTYGSEGLDRLQRYLEAEGAGPAFSEEEIHAICGDVQNCIMQFHAVSRLVGDTVPAVEAAAAEAERAEESLAQAQEDESGFRAALTRIKDFLLKCLQGFHLARGPQSGTVAVQYPFNGPLRAWSSRYRKESLREVIRAALVAGVDPYLALSIVAKENTTALARPTDQDGYAQEYGLVPIDQQAVIAQMGCLDSRPVIEHNHLTPEMLEAIPRSANHYDFEGDASWTDEQLSEARCLANPHGCVGVVRPSAHVRKIALSAVPGAPTVRLCEESRIVMLGGHANLVAVSSPGATGSGCCVDVTYDPKAKQDRFFNDVITQALTVMGLQLARDNVQRRAAGESVSHAIQRYNGLGCFGCGEKMHNPCLDHLPLGERPVYGAQAADLMVNAFMANPDVRALVAQEAQAVHRPVTSILCAHDGPGSHSLPVTQFLDEQRSYLVEGKEHGYKGWLHGSVRAPASDADRKQFEADEDKRARACTAAGSPSPVSFGPWTSLGEIRRFR